MSIKYVNGPKIEQIMRGLGIVLAGTGVGVIGIPESLEKGIAAGVLMIIAGGITGIVLPAIKSPEENSKKR